MDKEINILLIEDEASDSFLFQAALDKLDFNIDLKIISDQEEAYKDVTGFKVKPVFFWEAENRRYYIFGCYYA